MNAARMVGNDGRIPKLMRYVEMDEIENNYMRMIEHNFANQYGKEFKSVVALHTSYGQQFHVHYNETDQRFTNFGKIYRDFDIREDSVLVLCYIGAGNFLINVFNASYTEYDYNSLRQKTRDAVNIKERNKGVGWNFPVISIGKMQIHGGAFCRKIPEIVSIVLNNGDVLPGKLLLLDKKIYGLAPLYRKQFLKMFGILMFTYCGGDHFELSVFGKTKVEQIFDMPEFIDVLPDSEIESKSEEEIDEMAEDPVIQEINDNAVGFEVVITISNVNNSCHGAYLPRHITPNDRNWMQGEEIMLQTERGRWRVGLVLSKYLSRISVGWNKFVRDNDIELNNRFISLCWGVTKEYGHLLFRFSDKISP